MKTYDEFCLALRTRESSNNYKAVNSLGFVGAYQFGMARLCDLGFTQRINPASSSMANSAFQWKSGYSLEQFLNSPVMQDGAFLKHVLKLKASITARLGDKVTTTLVAGQYGTLSGGVAACHLLGLGGLQALIERQLDAKDAYGTKISEYFLKFSGFELPS